MITKLKVSNFRSLGPNVEVHPRTLTVLVGRNGSGKSNVLDALAFVRDAVTTGLPVAITQRGGIDGVRRRSNGRPFEVSIELDLKWGDEYSATYGFELTNERNLGGVVKSEKVRLSGPEGTVRIDRAIDGSVTGLSSSSPRLTRDGLLLTALGGFQHLRPLVDALSEMAVYQIFPDTLARPQVYDPRRPMRSHGENWVSILKELLSQKEARDDLVRALAKLNGGLEDLQVARAAEYLVAEFKQVVAGGKTPTPRWFGAGQQSDGTLRVAGILTALLQEPPLRVIGLEEPELTVHPGALGIVFDYIRQATERSQVWITSHSPHLLDLVDLNRDALFIVQRDQGVTRVDPLPESLCRDVQAQLLSPGELLVNFDPQQLGLFGS